jgi:hypothetical protein
MFPHDPDDPYCICTSCRMNAAILYYMMSGMPPTDRALLPVGTYNEFRPG